MQPGIAIVAERPEPGLVDRARRLSGELSLPLTSAGEPGYDLHLVVTTRRLELREAGSRTGPVYADFCRPRSVSRRQVSALARDPLIRAIGLKAKPWHVVDATAGLGRNAVLLAWAGCSVTAIERSPAIAALLGDGLRRAMEDPQMQPVVADRLHLVRGDAREVLAEMADDEQPDAVYMDPMFPHRAKSAASKKEMRLCRLVAGDDTDAAELFTIARRTARHRVVVKRWLRAPPLAPDPAIQYKGRSIRYDVYLRG
ncbi:MAG: class I SAM-dependent methyltransferase [Planctomycetes bacterium]|nr:class I SAM-dependent methyltransferase [Planctomycetota bacterium]